jgi:hypothetical protein
MSNYRAIAQVISRRPLTAETLVRARVSPCGGQSGSGTGFPPILSIFPVSIIPPWLSTLILSCGGWTIGPLVAAVQI